MIWNHKIRECLKSFSCIFQYYTYQEHRELISGSNLVSNTFRQHFRWDHVFFLNAFLSQWCCQLQLISVYCRQCRWLHFLKPLLHTATQMRIVVYWGCNWKLQTEIKKPVIWKHRILLLLLVCLSKLFREVTISQLWGHFS